RSKLPGGRPGPPRPIAKFRHGLIPRKDLPIFYESVFPVPAFLVTAPIDELLELLVGDFIVVEPVIIESHLRKTASLKSAPRNSGHGGREGAFAGQFEHRGRRSDAEVPFQRLKALLH